MVIFFIVFFSMDMLYIHAVKRVLILTVLPISFASNTTKKRRKIPKTGFISQGIFLPFL